MKLHIKSGKKTKRAKITRNFGAPVYWVTDRGDITTPEEMHTAHLFNAVKMLWNNVVPPFARVGEFTRHPEIKKWSEFYTVRAFNALLDELISRNLEQEQLDVLDDIEHNAEYLNG